jgi:hypothetical protein
MGSIVLEFLGPVFQFCAGRKNFEDQTDDMLLSELEDQCTSLVESPVSHRRSECVGQFVDCLFEIYFSTAMYLSGAEKGQSTQNITFALAASISAVFFTSLLRMQD